jgi:hypothetical protein
MWDSEFVGAIPGHTRSISNFLPSRRQTDRNDITLVTHASVSALSQLLAQIAVWGGPTSASIYIGDPGDLAELFVFLEANSENLQNTAIHVLMEKSELGYPRNMLRNAAMDGVESEYFLSLDVEFLIPSECHDNLRKLIESDQDIKRNIHNKTVHALPGVGLNKDMHSLEFMPGESLNKTLHALPGVGLNKDMHSLEFMPGEPLTEDAPPKTKTDIIQMIKEKRAKISSLGPLARGSTSVEPKEWMIQREKDEQVLFSAQGQFSLEPYVLGHRGSPRYNGLLFEVKTTASTVGCMSLPLPETSLQH